MVLLIFLTGVKSILGIRIRRIPHLSIPKELKSSQSKDYGIGHKKNFNKLLKSEVNAKKHPEIGCMC